MALWGVDGCRAGWFAFSSTGEHKLVRSFEELLDAIPTGRLYIDMPMGLTDDKPRRLESLARALLKGKASSVFSVPSRSAVYTDGYTQACKINEKRFGLKFSIQAWNICPKIKQVDAALRGHAPLCRRLFESHPELVFQGLAGGPLAAGKKTSEGIEARLQILERYQPRARLRYAEVLDRYPRKLVARDDILDAMVLAVLGSVPRKSLRDNQQARDGFGIPIRMMVPDYLAKGSS